MFGSCMSTLPALQGIKGVAVCWWVPLMCDVFCPISVFRFHVPRAAACGTFDFELWILCRTLYILTICLIQALTLISFLQKAKKKGKGSCSSSRRNSCSSHELKSRDNTDDQNFKSETMQRSWLGSDLEYRQVLAPLSARALLSGYVIIPILFQGTLLAAHRLRCLVPPRCTDMSFWHRP